MDVIYIAVSSDDVLIRQQKTVSSQQPTDSRERQMPAHGNEIVCRAQKCSEQAKKRGGLEKCLANALNSVFVQLRQQLSKLWRRVAAAVAAAPVARTANQPAKQASRSDADRRCPVEIFMKLAEQQPSRAAQNLSFAVENT